MSPELFIEAVAGTGGKNLAIPIGQLLLEPGLITCGVVFEIIGHRDRFFLLGID